MRRPAICLLVLLLTCGAADAEDPPPAREWRTYVEPLTAVGERLSKQLNDAEDAQLRQELYRTIFMNMTAAYFTLLDADREHPQFWPIFNSNFPQFAANPDNVYHSTPIAPDGIYKIPGYRGTRRIVDFQIAGGPLVPTGMGTLGPVYANYDLDKLPLGKEGYFEVILSSEKPSDYKGAWWKLDSKATYVLVRQVSYDWLSETDGRFAIERLDRPAVKPRRSAQDLETSMRSIASFAENWTKLGMDWTHKYETDGFVNKLMFRDITSQGGLSTQKYIEGIFQLAPDEALIYETDLPQQCRYWNVQLTDMLWVSLDAMNRQTVINGHTARIDRDGKFRAVISAEDPGVPNWLDTAGYSKGVVFGRWNECSSYPSPKLEKVKLVDVRKRLPDDTPTVSAAQREEQIRIRRQAAQLRHRW